MLTQSKIRCEKPAYLALFRLEYWVLCPYRSDIVPFELKNPFMMRKSNKTKYHSNSNHRWSRITQLLFKNFHLGQI